MVRMTPELDEALREWTRWRVDAAGYGVLLTREQSLLDAYRAAQEAEPEPRFRVGDRVRYVGNEPHYAKRIEQDGGTSMVAAGPYWTLGMDDLTTIMMVPESHLEPISDTLPPDHIDRFWVPGAWLTNGSVDYHIVVMSANVFARLWSDGSITSGKQSELDRDGWSFHEQSPIKEEVGL